MSEQRIVAQFEIPYRACLDGDGVPLGALPAWIEDGDLLRLEDILPSPDDGPDGLYLRNLLLDELELAINELPPEQREVFVAHEIEGISFKQMAAETGVNVNTLLARKRYAVRRLRERLQSIHEEFSNS